MKKIKFSGSQGAWTRLILLGFALVNQILLTLGYTIIPVEEETLNEFVGLSFLIGTALYTAWRDNNFTKLAQIKAEIAEEEITKAMKERELLANRDVSKVDKMEKK